MDSEGAVERVCINGVSVLSGLNLEKYKSFLSSGTKQTVLNNKVSSYFQVKLKKK